MTVSLILDALILVIAGLTIFLAIRRGFLKTIQSGVVFLLSILITLLLRQTVAALIYNTSLPQNVQTRIEEAVSSLLGSDAQAEKPADKDPETAEKSAPSFLQTALQTIGIDEEHYRNLLEEKKNGTVESLRSALNESVVPKAVNILVQAIAVIALFVVSNLLLRLLFWMLRSLIDAIPFLKATNRFLGVIAGILLAALRVFLFVAVVGALLRVSLIASLPVFSSFRTEDTFLFRWISAINPLNVFLS